MRTNISHANMDYKAGVIPLYKIKENVVSPHDRLCFLFSGAITNHTGFPMAFNVFKSLPDVDLFVSGFGNISGYNIEDYPNIHYLGYLDYDEYLKLYDKVDVCLSLRDPDFPENANNFPSKILEYFSYNKIVISTINYPELAGFRYVKSEYKEDALCEIVMELSSGNKQDLIELSDNREALKLNFSVESWMESFNKIELNAKKD
jgi:glycosyltransferase involved in cell wall biosynthesis